MFRMFRNPWVGLFSAMPETPTVRSLLELVSRLGGMQTPPRDVNCERQFPLWSCFQWWEVIRKTLVFAMPVSMCSDISLVPCHIPSWNCPTPWCLANSNLIPDKYSFLGFSSRSGECVASHWLIPACPGCDVLETGLFYSCSLFLASFPLWWVDEGSLRSLLDRLEPGLRNVFQT